MLSKFWDGAKLGSIAKNERGQDELTIKDLEKLKGKLTIEDFEDLKEKLEITE